MKPESGTMQNDPDEFAAARECLRTSDRLVAFTGAGISTESGIPDFRGPHGVWNEFDPGDLSITALRTTPEEYWARRREFEARIEWDAVDPNPAHYALAELEAAGLLQAVITQNVDGLHQAAGTDTVLELHGTRQAAECLGCGQRVATDVLDTQLANEAIPPRCPECAGLLKYATVAFGQTLPADTLEQARREIAAADTILVVGSSLTVEPAASLPQTGVKTGSELVIINLESTPLDSLATAVLRAEAGDILPRLTSSILD